MVGEMYMYRARKQRKFLIMGLVGIMLLMSVGYAAFQSNLKIRGTTRITSLWDVRITNVTAGTPTGSATNAVAPTWDKLTANMEANLYEKGDAMEYDVTITNNGTVDAVLSDIIGTPSNNDAVIITYSGYAKGEKLYKSGHTGNQKIVHVKIQYNPEYNGGNASGSSSIQFDFTQGEGGGQVDTDKYLLTYNYTYNGGASSTANDEYVEQNTTVSLSNKTALKPGWTFVGWNTNKDATTGLSNVKVNNNTTVYAIYSKTLTATYEKGEHVDSISKVTDTCTIYNLQTGCTKTLPVITPSAGYTVDTWYNGTIEVGKSGNSYELRSNVTLTTKAEANRYLVTYNYSENGGSSATKTEDNVAYDQNIDLTPTATKLGWTFVGWNTNKDATTKLTSLKMGTENVTLYAIYKKEAITLTAKFNENGSTLSSTEDESCTLPAVYNKETQITSCEIDAPTITAPANTPTIVGFNTAANSTTNNASYNTTTKKITLTEGNDNNTWYAITTKAKINRTITFYRNGNTNFIYNGTTYTNTSKAFTVCSIAATYNGEKQATSCTATLTMPTITAPANTPTIIGWSTRASTRTKSYSSGQENVSISMTGNKKYYAQTTKAKQTFTVTYEKDEGASAIGKVSDTCDLAVTYNGVAQATECSITLPSITASTGYTSDGWYNGNTKIGDSEDTYNISSNVTLTGKTTANVYTVTLDGKGVEQIPNKVYYQYNTTKKINNVTCYYYTDPELTTCITDGYKITPPTKVGYTFGGYYTSADGVGTQYVNASGAFINNVYKTAGDKTLQANWTANEYTINYSLNGGTKGTNAPSNGTYDTEIKIDNPTKKITITGDANGTGANIGSATNANQTFAGWTGTGLGSNAKSGAATGQTTSWNGAATTNTFFQNLNESGAVTLTANWTPVTVKLPTLSKEGYTCKWYTDETAGTELGSGGDNWLPSANSPANITAHARCTANTYTVIFNANGEGVEGTMANQTFTYDEEKNLSENAFTKAGYNFKGWAKSSTGTVEYANKEKVSNLVNSGTINLFAVWEDEDGPVISVTNTAGTTNFLTTAWNGNANATSGLGSFTVLIGATDTGSGINKVEYVINSNTENPSSGWTEIENGTPASASQPFGTYYIHVKATDNDGNISYATTKAMTIRYSIAFKDYATNTSTSKTLYATPSAPTITARTPATKTGYTFLGWYTSASGGTKVTDANVPYTPTKSITLYGHWQKEISDLTVIVADDEYTYDGTAKTPAVTVKDGNTVLTLNTDYTVTYQNNVNAGKGTVTVTMKNVYNSTTRSFYTGTDEYEFTIKKSDTTTSLSEITKTYNGSAQSVTGATSKLSSNSSDITNGSYTYTYYNGDSCSGTALTSAPKNAGIYSVKATLAGTSNYNTSTSSCVKYTINQKKATITVTDSTKELTYKAAGTNTYTYDGDGTVTCESSDTSKVTCSVDTTNKKITVTPVASTTDPVTITVKAGAGTNYSAADNKTFTVTVEKFQPTVNLTAKTGMKWTGNAHAANTATVTLTNSETYSGTITYTYYTNNSCSEGATTTAPTLAGSYWVKASIAAQGNYKEAASSCVAHTIAVATPTVSLTAKTATYSGSAIAANTATVSPNSNPTITYTYYTNSTCTTKTGTAAASGAAASAGAAPKQVGQWYVIASASEVANKTEAAASSCTSHKINQKKATITVQDPTVQLTYGTNDSNTYTYDGDGTVSCQSSDTSKVTCTVDTTNKKIKLTPVALTTTPVTITVKAGAGTNYSAADNKTFTVTVTDGSVPTAEITSTSTLKSTTQTATLKCDDDVGVVSYYWGTTAPTSSSQYETITSTKNMSITKTVNAAGTYYLSCKDSSGNATQTPASKVYNSYTVNNMLQNVSGDTYTTTHYTQTSTNTFIAPNGTNLTTTSIYTVPNGSNQERYVGISEGAASTTEAAVNQTNTTLNENKIISVWFTRNIVKIKYKSNEGTVRASTKASDGTVYTWTTDSDDIINISIDGDAVRQATSSYRYGVSKIDVLNFNNSSYLYISKTGFVGPSGQEWICDSGCTTPNMTIKQSSWTLPVPQGGVSTDTLCDAKNDDCTIVIKVNWKESTTIPTAAKYCNELTYTGEEQTLTKTAGTGYTFSGNSGTNAGEYTVTATLASGHAWSDRGVGVKTFKCSVNKATPVITLSPSALTVGIEDTDTFTATVKSGASNGTVSGTLTVESEANEIASVTPESKTITSANNSTGVETTETVTGVSIGTSTISANFTPDSNSSSNYNAAAVKTITATVADTTVPTVNDIAGGTTLKATSQSLTLKASDNIGITAYYFGTTEPASASAITTTTNDDLTSIQGSGLTKNVTQEGTYWFAVKDAAGNFSKKSIVIRKYQVQNVLETIAASSNTTYTNANYAALNDTKTYYVKDGTTLTLTSSYTKPTGGNTFKGYTTSAPSATAQTPSTTNPKVATNNTTVYYMWFTRLTYTVTVSKPTNGSVTAETVTKTGNSVTASTAASSLTVKYGDTVKATATPNTNCEFESWSGGYVSGSTNPVTGAAVTSAKTITATFKVLPIIKSWVVVHLQIFIIVHIEKI